MTRLESASIRDLRCTDEREVRRFFGELGPESRFRRFHAPVHSVPEVFFSRLFVPVHPSTRAVVAVVGRSLVGLAQLVPSAAPEAGRGLARPPSAELAVVVAEAFRRRGLARRLLVGLGAGSAADDLGGWRLRAEIQADNEPALALARSVVPRASRRREGCSVVFELEIPRSVRPGSAPRPGTADRRYPRPVLSR